MGGAGILPLIRPACLIEESFFDEQYTRVESHLAFEVRVVELSLNDVRCYPEMGCIKGD